LPFGALDQSNHPVQKCLPGIRGDPDFDDIGKDTSATGDGGPVAACFANDGRRFTGNRRLVDRRNSLDHFSIARNEISGRNQNHVAATQFCAGNAFSRAIW